MTIYVPVTRFAHGDIKHDIAELNAEDCKIIGGYIECRGTIYSNVAYTDPQGVWLDWNKEYHKAEEFRYRF